MMAKLMPTALAVALILGTQVQAGFISYQFNSLNGNSQTITADPLVSGTNVGGTGLSNLNADVNGIRRYSFDNTSSYLTFTVSTQDGITPLNYTINGFDIFGRKAPPSPPVNLPPSQLQVLVSSDNFATFSSLGTFNPSTSNNTYSNTLGSPVVINSFAGTLEFRIVATAGNFGGNGVNDWFQITNGLIGSQGISINGTVQAVPEPTSLALLGLSLGAMGTYARRRLKKTPVETEAAV